MEEEAAVGAAEDMDVADVATRTMVEVFLPPRTKDCVPHSRYTSLTMGTRVLLIRSTLHTKNLYSMLVPRLDRTSTVK